MAALVLAGHGSHRNPDSAAPVFAHADRLRASGAFETVREAFWKEEPSLREVLRTLDEEMVYVVPLFTSEGYFTREVLPRELRLTDEFALDVEKTVRYTPPVGTHDAMTDVVLDRAESVTGRSDLSDVALALVGHGTERNPDSAASTRYHADRLRDRGRFAAVHALFMDEAPAVADLTARVAHEDVALVPLFVSDGYHTTEDIPEDVGLTDDHRTGWPVPAAVDGHRVWYAGAVGTEPHLARVVAERAAEAGAAVDPASVPLDADAARPSRTGSRRSATVDPVDRLLREGADLDGLVVEQAPEGYLFETPTTRREGCTPATVRSLAASHPAYVSNWHHFTHELDAGLAGVAFLRWVERADETPVPERYDALPGGVTRPWGDLAVTATLSEGSRRYDVRHVADRGRAVADLDVHRDPLDARAVARFTDEGGYRPLKTAPTLATGWVFPALDGDVLLDVVDFLYPASVANRHREREDRLDVTHWRETAARQTGRYAAAADLPREALDRAVAACCADDACVKRREWDHAPDDAVAVPRGGGEFPCREPCSLFVAAAREWARAERADDGRADRGLTPTDRSQLAAVLDAVAEGRTGDVRDGDVEDPANRYRVRYLRAKLFGENGAGTAQSGEWPDRRGGDS